MLACTVPVAVAAALRTREAPVEATETTVVPTGTPGALTVAPTRAELNWLDVLLTVVDVVVVVTKKPGPFAPEGVNPRPVLSSLEP
jgi:hypothetical protein